MTSDLDITRGLKRSRDQSWKGIQSINIYLRMEDMAKTVCTEIIDEILKEVEKTVELNIVLEDDGVFPPENVLEETLEYDIEEDKENMEKAPIDVSAENTEEVSKEVEEAVQNKISKDDEVFFAEIILDIVEGAQKISEKEKVEGENTKDPLEDAEKTVDKYETVQEATEEDDNQKVSWYDLFKKAYGSWGRNENKPSEAAEPNIPRETPQMIWETSKCGHFFHVNGCPECKRGDQEPETAEVRKQSSLGQNGSYFVCLFKFWPG